MDGSLPAALDRLYAAVAAMIDPVKEWHDGRLLAAPSLYEQLCDLVERARRRGDGGRVGASSRSPAWWPALDLKIELDDEVRTWHPQGASTVKRLREVAAAKWRPQDCDTLDEKSARLEAWAVKIGELVDPPPRKYVKAACPACGVKTVYRQNDVGESVRVPALQLIPDEGCTCLACTHTWPPEHYLLLCKVLGFDTPEGVTL